MTMLSLVGPKTQQNLLGRTRRMHDKVVEESTHAEQRHEPLHASRVSADSRADPDQADGLNSLLQELRVLQQGVQVLTGFLIILPFTQDFGRLDVAEKWVYLVTFACALCSLILFSAPAAQHRLEWPLLDRARFKLLATRMIIAGLAPLSLAFVLATQLVVAQVLGGVPALFAALGVGALIVAAWWLFPVLTKHKRGR
jgi:hypothetical protein